MTVLLPFGGTSDNLKTSAEFVFNSVKLDSSTSPQKHNNFMSFAEWEDEHTVSLSYHGYNFLADGANESFSFRAETFAVFSMRLDGDRLTVFIPNFVDAEDEKEYSCEHHKEN